MNFGGLSGSADGHAVNPQSLSDLVIMIINGKMLKTMYLICRLQTSPSKKHNPFMYFSFVIVLQSCKNLFTFMGNL